jgi:HAD superfamily hydrolase (TIGR01509 family)
MKKQFDAVLWDFDGVIVDSERLWLEAAPLFYEKQVGTRISSQQQEKFVGGSLRNAWTILFQEYGLKSDFAQFEKDCVEFAIREMYPNVNLIPGVWDTIKMLQSHGVKQAIGTSGHRGWFDPTFERLGLAEFFDIVVASEDVYGVGKPAPDIFLCCAELLQVETTKCLVIEDSANGCVAGKSAGAEVWGFRNGWNEKQDLSMADWEFSSFLEMLEKMKKVF